jgi:hypothetical protein
MLRQIPPAMHLLGGVAVGFICYPQVRATVMVAILVAVSAAVLGGVMHYLAWLWKVPVDFPGLSGVIVGTLVSIFLTVPLTGLGAIIAFWMRRAWHWLRQSSLSSVKK